MAIKYTYDDFRKALESSGLQDSFSDYDLRLAEKDPSAGMSLIRYKSDYRNAATDEARALANEGAESVRRTYGGYTGGGDGSGYYLETPSSFRYDKAAPVYENRYGEAASGALKELTEAKPFSYDYRDDPVYSSYKKEYTREGKRAAEDTLGSFAAASGGIPSSYAATAAGQAGDYYASKLSDKIPELYDAAYSRYLNEYNLKQKNYETLRDAEANDYSRYLDELDRYNSDKADAYNKHLTNINYYDNRENAAEQAAKAAAQQEFENDMTLRAQDREDSELERKRAADLVDEEIRRGQLELDKNSDDWKKQVALEELGLKGESQAWDREYGLRRLALTNSGGSAGDSYMGNGGVLLETEPPIVTPSDTGNNENAPKNVPEKSAAKDDPDRLARVSGFRKNLSLSSSIKAKTDILDKIKGTNKNETDFKREEALLGMYQKGDISQAEFKFLLTKYGLYSEKYNTEG